MPGGSMGKSVERGTRIIDMLWYSAYLYDIVWTTQLYSKGNSIIQGRIRSTLINQILAGMLVGLLVQGGACVAAAALDNDYITSSNIERSVRMMNFLPSTSLR